MVIVYVAAGLANRMFHYAFALSLKKQTGYNVYIDEHTFKPRFDFETTKLSDAFTGINLQESPVGKFKLAHQKGLLPRIFRRLSVHFPNFRYIERWKLDYDESVFKKCSRDCVYLGHWVNYHYFDNCEEDVRNAFIFKDFEDARNKELQKKLNDENSVAVHFRKNVDYLSDPQNNERCSVAYYEKAIQYILDHVDNPRFYFFSDNWDWVKDNINLPIKFTKIDWNPVSGNGSYYDMQLMSSCKHNIIANSTYSWWAAWLNNNPLKIVVAPKAWYKIVDGDTDQNMCPNTWIKF